MKSFRRLSLGYAVALAAAALLSASVEAATIKNTGVIRAIRGSAEVSGDGGKSWQKARVGTKMGANSAVKTADKSIVDIFLGENGPVVRVREGTTMGIDKLDLDNTGVEKVIETQLDLRNGQILGSVKKMAAASKYEVKTPVGVAGIRGTEYSINSRGQLKVVSGTVLMVYVVNGVVMPPVTVQAGQQAAPPVAANQPVTLTGMTVIELNEVQADTTVIVASVQTLPNGQMTTTLEGTGQNAGTGSDGGTAGGSGPPVGDGTGSSDPTPPAPPQPPPPPPPVVAPEQPPPPPFDTTKCNLTPGDPNRPPQCDEQGTP